ncbi:MAG TPA: hypothetical protein VN736_06005 [Candidatus Limnocylindrales bacterium]|nr:hypothetical protein [Candidatus Limnocylindrales bacterium]
MFPQIGQDRLRPLTRASQHVLDRADADGFEGIYVGRFGKRYERINDSAFLIPIQP